MDLDKLYQGVKTELTQNLLPFWMRFADKTHGGFYGWADFNNQVDRQAPKGTVLQARILWAYSAAFCQLGDPRLQQTARHAFDFLVNRAYDSERGGFYWSLDSQGRVLDSRKHIYGQAFILYALVEYHRATGDNTSLILACDQFRLIEQHSWDATHLGYLESFTADWRIDPENLICDTEDGIVTAKSMNTHLHLLEAYTNLYRAWPDAKLASRLRTLIELAVQQQMNPTTHQLYHFFDVDWTVHSQNISFGHDIEASWLIDEATKVLDDPALMQQVGAITLKTAERTFLEGLDHDGSMFNECRHGHLIDSDKIWWVQAEAMVGFLNAYQKSGETRFALAAEKLWAFISAHLVDRVNGEWHWKVNRFGQPYTDQPKVEPWKCPYHNVRGCLEMLVRIDAIKSLPKHPGH